MQTLLATRQSLIDCTTNLLNYCCRFGCAEFHLIAIDN